MEILIYNKNSNNKLYNNNNNSNNNNSNINNNNKRFYAIFRMLRDFYFILNQF